MRLRTVLGLIGAALTPLVVQAQVLTFDQPTSCTGGQIYLAGPWTCAAYTENGYTLRRESGADGSFADVVLSRDDGTAFSLASLDLMEDRSNPINAPITVPYPATVRVTQNTEFIGTRADGSVISELVATDQVSGFQTFASGAFTDLVSLQVRPNAPYGVITVHLPSGDWTYEAPMGMPAIVLDNVALQPSVAAIPEPATTALLLPSLGILWWMTWRRRAGLR